MHTLISVDLNAHLRQNHRGILMCFSLNSSKMIITRLHKLFNTKIEIKVYFYLEQSVLFSV